MKTTIENIKKFISLSARILDCYNNKEMRTEHFFIFHTLDRIYRSFKMIEIVLSKTNNFNFIDVPIALILRAAALDTINIIYILQEPLLASEENISDHQYMDLIYNNAKKCQCDQIYFFLNNTLNKQLTEDEKIKGYQYLINEYSDCFKNEKLSIDDFIQRKVEKKFTDFPKPYIILQKIKDSKYVNKDFVYKKIFRLNDIYNALSKIDHHGYLSETFTDAIFDSDNLDRFNLMIFEILHSTSLFICYTLASYIVDNNFKPEIKAFIKELEVLIPKIPENNSPTIN